MILLEVGDCRSQLYVVTTEDIHWVGHCDHGGG